MPRLVSNLTGFLADHLQFPVPLLADWTRIHKHAQHITLDFTFTAHIYHSEYVYVGGHHILAALKNESKQMLNKLFCDPNRNKQ